MVRKLLWGVALIILTIVGMLPVYAHNGDYDEGDIIPGTVYNVPVTEICNNGNYKYIPPQGLELERYDGDDSIGGGNVTYDSAARDIRVSNFTVNDIVGGTGSFKYRIKYYKIYERSTQKGVNAGDSVSGPSWATWVAFYDTASASGGPIKDIRYYGGSVTAPSGSQSVIFYNSNYREDVSSDWYMYSLVRHVQSISLTPASATLIVGGDPENFNITVVPSDAYDKTWSWDSNPYVTASGSQLTGKAAGDTTVMVRSNGVKKNGSKATDTVSAKVIGIEFDDVDRTFYFNDTTTKNGAFITKNTITLKYTGSFDVNQLGLSVDSGSDFTAQKKIENGVLKLAIFPNGKNIVNQNYTVTATYPNTPKKTFNLNLTLYRVLDSFILDYQPSFTIFKGNTYDLKGTMTPSNPYDKGVNWGSSKISSTSSTNPVSISSTSNFVYNGNLRQKATIKGDAIGSSKISASSIAKGIDGNTKMDEVNVNVIDVSLQMPTPGQHTNYYVADGAIYFNSMSAIDIKLNFQGTYLASNIGVSLNSPSNALDISKYNPAGTNDVYARITNIDNSINNQTFTLKISTSENGATDSVTRNITLTLKRVIDSYSFNVPSFSLFPGNTYNTNIITPANTYSLNATLNPANAYDETVTWNNGNTTAVTMSTETVSGTTHSVIVTANSPGNSTITSTTNGYDINHSKITATALVKVIDFNFSMPSVGAHPDTSNGEKRYYIDSLGHIYYDSNSVVDIRLQNVNLAAPIIPEQLTVSVDSNINFDATRVNYNGNVYLRISNLKGNITNGLFTINFSYIENSVVAVQKKKLSLTLKRVVDSLHMPNETVSSQPMVVFKSDSIDLKHTLEPYDRAGNTEAYLGLVSWTKSSDTNISFDSYYSDFNNSVGETKSTASPYVSILPIKGENVGTSIVKSKSNGIDILGQRKEQTMDITVIDILNRFDKSILDNFDIMMVSDNKAQPVYSKDLKVVGSDYDFDKIRITPDYNPSYFKLNIISNNPQKTFTIKLTPKKATPLDDNNPLNDGTVLKLNFQYENDDQYKTVTEIIRTSKINIYPYDMVQ